MDRGTFSRHTVGTISSGLTSIPSMHEQPGYTHTAVMKGLEPSSTYSYKVGDPGEKAAEGDHIAFSPREILIYDVFLPYLHFIIYTQIQVYGVRLRRSLLHLLQESIIIRQRAVHQLTNKLAVVVFDLLFWQI